MGVIGFDLCRSGIGGVSRKLGRPRQQSKHTIHANDNYNVVAEAESILAGAEAEALV